MTGAFLRRFDLLSAAPDPWCLNTIFRLTRKYLSGLRADPTLGWFPVGGRGLCPGASVPSSQIVPSPQRRPTRRDPEQVLVLPPGPLWLPTPKVVARVLALVRGGEQARPAGLCVFVSEQPCMQCMQSRRRFAGFAAGVFVVRLWLDRGIQAAVLPP